jgi:hypothetical protein
VAPNPGERRHRSFRTWCTYWAGTSGSQSPASAALATQRIDQTPTLGDILCKRESRLSSLLNAHSLAFGVIKRAISFGLNLHRPGYDILRSPLGFSDDIASRGLRLSYDALCMRCGNGLSLGKL